MASFLYFTNCSQKKVFTNVYTNAIIISSKGDKKKGAQHEDLYSKQRNRRYY